jgi:hypothetical protein
VNFSSQGSPEFWRRYRALPAEIKALARKNYRLWLTNRFHPSLRLKSIGKNDDWSVRVGNHYRAVGKFSGNCFVWEWIGTHEEYNKTF